MLMTPLSGWRMPVNMLIVVDLPAPLWPKRQKTSFSKRLRLNLFTTVFESNDLLISFKYMLIFL